METIQTDRNKWLVRAGALLLLIGFILPSVLVSCAGAPEYGRALSLYDIASLVQAPLLYLVPLGGLAVLILAFLPARPGAGFPAAFWGQVAGAVVGIAGILLPLISLSGQLQEFGYQLSPQAGMLVLVSGYVLIGVGLAGEWGEMRRQPSGWEYPAAEPRVAATYNPPPPPIPSWAAPYPPPHSLSTQPPDLDDRLPTPPAPAVRPVQREHLRVVRGSLPVTIIPLTHDGFTIGRDPGSDLHLPDLEVSRQHARLRFGQGAWFIQDTDSAGGIRINGKAALAHRLEDGDQVGIGEYVFRFCKPPAAGLLEDEE